MFYIAQNNMIEWSYESEKAYTDPFNDIELSVIITDPDSEQKEIPAFWAGGQTWRALCFIKVGRSSCKKCLF